MKKVGETSLKPSVAEHIGDYALLRRIGAGAYADVWLAKDAVGKCVAVKVIDRERLALLSRRNREEEALALLRNQLPEHPHLIRVHHVGTDGDRFYYVMDLADDVAALRNDGSQSRPVDAATYKPHTLSDEIDKNAPLPVPEAISVVRQLLGAVRCLHDNGIIHRDIKPSNVVCIGGLWKLADIGLLTEEATEITAIGTPDFMPPSGIIDRTADIYALGKLLYCLVTGHPPRAFPTIPPSIVNTRDRWVIAEINEIITRACSPKIERRYQSVDDFNNALCRCLKRTRPRWLLHRKLSRRAWIGICVGLVAIGSAAYLSAGAWRSDPAETVGADREWTLLFNGRDLTGWYKDKPFHGQWSVADGVITVEPTDEYKTLLTEGTYGPGTIRATVIPGHDGARIGVGYLANPAGPLFMFMGDKYTWLRGYRAENPPDEAGNWRSFPGPILKADEAAEFEIQYGPDGVVLRVNGNVLQQLPGVAGDGHIVLHVWKDDGGGFEDIMFSASE